MKKIVRLTESDLVKLVKRVIREQASGSVKGPEMNVKDAGMLAKIINTAGTYIDVDDDFKFLKPLNITFGIHSSTPVKFGVDVPEQGTKKETVMFNVGDMFNVTSSGSLRQEYPAMVVKTADGKPLQMVGKVGESSGLIHLRNYGY